MSERCMCGATDCPDCGPAQGYRVERDAMGRHFNPGTAELVREQADSLLESGEWRQSNLVDIAADHPNLLLAIIDEGGKCWDASTELERLLEQRAMHCAEMEVEA